MATVFKRAGSGRNDKWVVKYFDASTNTWRQRVGYTDKESSEALGRRLEVTTARQAEGIADPLEEQRRRPVTEHLTEFVEKIKAMNRDPRYVSQIEQRIQRMIDGTNVSKLHEFDPVIVTRFLSGLRVDGESLSGVTRNEYITTLKAFTRWAVEARRIDVDPLASLKRIERRAVVKHHPRRALSVDEIRRLLVAALIRPVEELQTVRTGKNKGKMVAKVKPAAYAKACSIGANRRLAYMLAIWTGLRRSELKALRWSDISFDTLPVSIRLRAETTKSRRADAVVLHPQIEQVLRAIRPNVDGLVLQNVPSIRVFQADCKRAGIDLGTRSTGFVDFHCLRMTLSTMMAANGMSQRARQAQMRHTDPRLTENVYMDERLLPVADELTKVPAIPLTEEEAPKTLPISNARQAS